MEATANTLLGFLIVMCMGLAMSGISLLIQAVVWLITIAYLIYWFHEALK